MLDLRLKIVEISHFLNTNCVIWHLKEKESHAIFQTELDYSCK